MGEASYVGGLFSCYSATTSERRFFCANIFMKNRLTVFGTIQFVRTRFDNQSYSKRFMGGNGLVASLAASKYANVDLIGVVGSDLDKTYLKKILGDKISVDNVEQISGNTFDYKATYHLRSYELLGQVIDFGAYEKYSPRALNEKIKHSKYILFSGSKPQLSLVIERQLLNPEVIAVDTLMYHLENNFNASVELIDSAMILFINNKEYEFLQEKLNSNLFKAFKRLRYVIRKNGKEGIDVITPEKVYLFKPSKVVKPLNPINAGDAISGVVMGMIAMGKSLNKNLNEIISTAQDEALKTILNDKFYRKEYKKDSI